jgi:hypothetical protein
MSRPEPWQPPLQTGGKDLPMRKAAKLAVEFGVFDESLGL